MFLGEQRYVGQNLVGRASDRAEARCDARIDQLRNMRILLAPCSHEQGVDRRVYNASFVRSCIFGVSLNPSVCLFCTVLVIEPWAGLTLQLFDLIGLYNIPSLILFSFFSIFAFDLFYPGIAKSPALCTYITGGQNVDYDEKTLILVMGYNYSRYIHGEKSDRNERNTRKFNEYSLSAQNYM